MDQAIRRPTKATTPRLQLSLLGRAGTFPPIPNPPKTAAIRPLPLPPPPMPPAPPAPVAAPSLVDTLFQRSLDDLVKSLRADPSAAGESAAVARALSEIQREIRAADAATKAVALQKLTYLSSLHFAPVAPHPLAFPAIELLASPHLPHKRIAYLAAALLLLPASLSLLPLATHQLHKDLSPSASFSRRSTARVGARSTAPRLPPPPPPFRTLPSTLRRTSCRTSSAAAPAPSRLPRAS
uniref:Uncharacterized protein n=1 Tax=Eleusine coracana subsp. coracana TaxID=191504 RepID=A0AAV5FZM1_ELECO|nr:hypothetical protein PR202_gn00458 [Eleusine coracana subsp. coracana]